MKRLLLSLLMVTSLNTMAETTSVDAITYRVNDLSVTEFTNMVGQRCTAMYRAISCVQSSKQNEEVLNTLRYDNEMLTTKLKNSVSENTILKLKIHAMQLQQQQSK